MYIVSLSLYPGQLNITGNEQPLIIGLSRDINCTWSGEINVTMMEWFVVGLEAIAVETTTGSRSILLTLEPDSDGLDGAMFTCRATLSDGREIERTITLTVQGILDECLAFFDERERSNCSKFGKVASFE